LENTRRSEQRVRYALHLPVSARKIKENARTTL